jgi:hypothetical protein
MSTLRLQRFILITDQKGHLHYILSINDYTRWTMVYQLPEKMKETCIAAYQHYPAKGDIYRTGYKIERFRWQ